MSNQIRSSLSKPLMQIRNPARSLHMIVLLWLLNHLIQRPQFRRLSLFILRNDLLQTFRTIIFLPLQISSYTSSAQLQKDSRVRYRSPGFNNLIKFLNSGIGSPLEITHMNNLTCRISYLPSNPLIASSSKTSSTLKLTFSGQNPCGGAFARLISEASILTPGGRRGEREVDQIPVPVPMSAIKALFGKGMERWRWVLLGEAERKSWCWRFRRAEARAWCSVSLPSKGIPCERVNRTYVSLEWIVGSVVLKGHGKPVVDSTYKLAEQSEVWSRGRSDKVWDCYITSP